MKLLLPWLLNKKTYGHSRFSLNLVEANKTAEALVNADLSDLKLNDNFSTNTCPDAFVTDQKTCLASSHSFGDKYFSCPPTRCGLTT